MDARRLSVVTLLFLMLSGCAYNAGYNPKFVDYHPEVTALLPGKALVYLSEKDLAYTFTGNPTSITGGATTLTIPLGEITRRLAVTVFETRFEEGTAFSTDLDESASYHVVIEPHVTQYSYAYNQLKNIGFAITPQVDMALEVKVVDAMGKLVLESTYTTDDFEGTTYFISGAPGETISDATHDALAELLDRAASDLVTKLALAK